VLYYLYYITWKANARGKAKKYKRILPDNKKRNIIYYDNVPSKYTFII